MKKKKKYVQDVLFVCLQPTACCCRCYYRSLFLPRLWGKKKKEKNRCRNSYKRREKEWTREREKKNRSRKISGETKIYKGTFFGGLLSSGCGGGDDSPPILPAPCKPEKYSTYSKQSFMIMCFCHLHHLKLLLPLYVIILIIFFCSHKTTKPKLWSDWFEGKKGKRKDIILPRPPRFTHVYIFLSNLVVDLKKKRKEKKSYTV